MDAKRPAYGLPAEARRATTPEFFGFVQVLRGVAALWVVFFHAIISHKLDVDASSAPVRWLLDGLALGYVGVSIFFALSGFVIAHSLHGKDVTARFIGLFALRRSLRLDPPYWGSILWTGLFGAAGWIAGAKALTIPSASAIAANLTYTQYLFDQPFFNIVYWTLTYEIQFYLVFCVALFAARRLGRGVLVILFLVALAWGSGLATWRPQGLFIDQWHCFFLGVLAYWSHRDRLARLAFFALLAVIVAARPEWFNLGSAGTALLLFTSRETGFIRNGLTFRPLMALGTISYSLYLTHNPTSGAAAFALTRLGVPPVAQLFVIVPACVLAATGFWYVVERPSVQLAHRIRSWPWTRPRPDGASA